jgi:hypothetical protein
LKTTETNWIRYQQVLKHMGHVSNVWCKSSTKLISVYIFSLNLQSDISKSLHHCIYVMKLSCFEILTYEKVWVSIISIHALLKLDYNFLSPLHTFFWSLLQHHAWTSYKELQDRPIVQTDITYTSVFMKGNHRLYNKK